MINEGNKRQLKALTQNPAYEALLVLAADLMDKWQSTGIKADSEFETIWNVAKREAKVEALKEFLYSLERQAFDA
jgi:hypothetical protein